MTIIVFIIILAVLVLVHEFGHFLAAKRQGVLVEEFGFGFPPRLFGKKIGETIYSINLIPLGGFVKLYGEEYQELKNEKTSALRDRAFVYKKPSKKALIIIGGVLMNFVLAVLVYYITVPLNNFSSDLLPTIVPYHFRFGQQEHKVVISGVIAGSEAAKAGIEGGDLAIRIGTMEKYNVTWTPIVSSEQFINTVKKSLNKPVYLIVENISNGEQKTVSAVPRYDTRLKRAIIGINLVEADVIHYNSTTDKLLSGFMNSYNLTAFNIKSIIFLFSQSYAKKSISPIADTSSGPIGIFRIVDQTVNSSGKKLVTNLLNLLALLSISLGIINILPFPALDGGRLVFIVYEGLTKKRANENVEKYFNLIGFLFLIMLAILVSLNDIMKIYK